MERISVFDMFKIGVGPSSSHTMGPWRAARYFVHALEQEGTLASVDRVTVHLYGSLAKTGVGHGTDLAVIMGLSGTDPETVDPALVPGCRDRAATEGAILLGGKVRIDFDPSEAVQFHFDESLPYHPNGMRFEAERNGSVFSQQWYSVGGGFVLREGVTPDALGPNPDLPFPIDLADDLVRWCEEEGLGIYEVVRRNERWWRPEDESIDADLDRLWQVMEQSILDGCRTTGILPGGLNVKRRAAELSARLMPDGRLPESVVEIVAAVDTFEATLGWLSVFALAVNEMNASFGRVVTAPTNGAAGVIPAVGMYLKAHCGADAALMRRYLLVAGEVGALFKKGATISAAMGGCQAEIGVSSAMAAAGLCEARGGTPRQALMAAEIAMEHHLGLTCDPIRGLVQVPCIERNAMGAAKAITATQLALNSDPHAAKVCLDSVIRTMWDTAQGMSEKYKETSEAGLAVHVPVSLPEC